MTDPGKLFRILYRLCWALAFAGALYSMGVVAYRQEAAVQRLMPHATALGFVTYSNASLRGQLIGPFGPLGTSAGIQPADLLLAVDGREFPKTRDDQAALLEGASGQIVRLTVKRQNGLVETIEIAPDREALDKAYAGSGLTFNLRRSISFVIRCVAALAALAAALMLLLRRPRDPVAQLLSTSLVLGYVNLQALFPGLPPYVSYFVGSLSWTGLLAAILLFPDGRMNTRWHWVAMGLCGLQVVYGAFIFWFSAPGLEIAYFAMATYAAVTVAAVMQFRRTPPGLERQQLKSVLFGIVVAMLLLGLSRIMELVEWRIEPEGAKAWATLAKQTFLPLGNLAVPAGLLVALLRYRLYDAEAAISRSAAYGTLTLLMLAIFAGASKAVETIGDEYFGESLGALAGAVGAAVAAMMLVPLHHRLNRWAENRFQKQLLRLRSGLPLLVGDMRETARLEEVGASALDCVAQGVRARRAALLVGDDVIDARGIEAEELAAWRRDWVPASRGFLDCDPSDSLLPLRVPLEAEGHGHVGWLLLGPRPDGSFYGKDEREALADIADPLARALAIVRKREERDAKREEALKRQGSALRSLSRRFAALERQLARLLGTPESSAT